MANDMTTDRYAPQRYRHLPTLVEGIVYDGTVECARAIVQWGQDRTGNRPFVIEGDDLHALTPQGLRYVPEGDLAVLGVISEPYSVQPGVRELAYNLVEANYTAPLPPARVNELKAEAHSATEPQRLREIVDALVAHSEALQA